MKKKSLILTVVTVLAAISLSACVSSSQNQTNNDQSWWNDNSNLFWFTPKDNQPSKTTFAADTLPQNNYLGGNSDQDDSSSIVFDKWRRVQTTDKFGDTTNVSVTTYITKGTFSNSATTNSDLYVSATVYNDMLMFKLLEYGTYKVINTYSQPRYYDIAYKLENGTTGTATGIMTPDDGEYLVGVDFDISLLILPNHTIKFVITETDRPSTKYSFSIKTTGFSEMYGNF